VSTFADVRRSFGHSVDEVVSRAVHQLGRALHDGPGQDEGAAPRSAVMTCNPPSVAAPEPAEALTAEDRAILARVEDYLARGLVLKRWWDRAYAADSFGERFGLGRSTNPADRSFGFFDQVTQDGAGLPIMGNYQEMFYDRPKAQRTAGIDLGAWMRAQVSEFALHYFMRVSDFRDPEGYIESDRGTSSPCLKPFSWCPDEPSVVRKGFGFQQLFYKRTTGEIGKFAEAERFAIVDLRELGRRFEWIVLKVAIFDFSITVEPLGAGGPRLVLPLQEDSYLVLTRDFVRDETGPGGSGRYGIGYSFIKNPRQSLLAYGPGEFDAAIELIDWVVGRDGTTHVEMAFVANRPDRILNFSLDPVGWGLRAADLMSLGLASRFMHPFQGMLGALPLRAGVDPVFSLVSLANLMSGGLAGQELCISRETLEKEFLLKHYMQHYQTIAGSLATWRQVGDWFDPAQIPARVITGKSA
jgi:hypothetical protein